MVASTAEIRPDDAVISSLSLPSWERTESYFDRAAS